MIIKTKEKRKVEKQVGHAVTMRNMDIMKCLTEKVKFEYILDLKEVRELAIWIAEEKHSRQEEEQVQML